MEYYVIGLLGGGLFYMFMDLAKQLKVSYEIRDILKELLRNDENYRRTARNEFFARGCMERDLPEWLR
jgi:hypothetical protein